MPSDAAVRALLDRAAVHEVMLRYARGVDRRDLDEVAACFTPDAVYDGALSGSTIGDALARLREVMERYTSTLHFVGNVVVELAGDTAACETYAIAYHRLRAAPRQQRVVAVRYLDALERREGRWLIVRRVVRREWERSEEIADP